MTEKRKYKNIHDKNIILLYSGELTFELQNSLVSTLEMRIDRLETDKKVKKRFYNVATECIQNLFYHTEEIESDNEHISELESRSVTVVVYALKKHFIIQTSNYIPSSKIKELQCKLDDLNSKSDVELREMYKATLSNSQFTQKGTAGLGYIDIARKSKQKLEYEFFEMNQQYNLYTFTARVPRTEIAD